MNRKLTKHRLQLETRKKDLLEQTKVTEGLQEHEGLRDSIQELSVVDNHPADVGSENYERAKDISLHEKNQLVLKKVEKALKKIELGNYGVCENCGKEITDERLDAVPYAEFCVECKKKEESAPHDYPRPVEELNLMSPHARSYMDETDYSGFNGEDAWQAVDRFNKLPHIYYEDTSDENEDNIGAVEDTDRISNDEYEAQLPD